jgi:nucleotide-binding universal stress UspA family protein
MVGGPVSLLEKGEAMSYKTIVVHVDRSPHATARIALAARVAVAAGAHLIGTAMTGLSRFMYQGHTLDPSRTVLAAQLAVLTNHANQSLAHFEAIAGAEGVQSWERRLVDDEDAAGLVLQARFADLVVMSQSDPDDERARLDPALPAFVMLNSACPSLIVPYANAVTSMGTHVLIGWNKSMQVSRAVASAIPLLQTAHKVSVVIFNGSPEPGEAGADIATYLARHDVNVEVMLEQTRAHVGDALLSRAADIGADLIVAGGYGHTRFRELLLGGVTQTLFDSMTVPVMLSH